MGGAEGAESLIMLNIGRLKGETTFYIFASFSKVNTITIILLINVIISMCLLIILLGAGSGAPTVGETWRTPLALLASLLHASSFP